MRRLALAFVACTHKDASYQNWYVSMSVSIYMINFSAHFSWAASISLNVLAFYFFCLLLETIMNNLFFKVGDTSV